MKTLFSTAAMTALSMAVMAVNKPDVTGTIVDDNGEPMSFVNVVLLSLPDSTFVQGATSDPDGKFTIITPETDGILKLSSIGYETLYINTHDYGESIEIRMKEDSKTLSEVTVKGQLPKTKLTGNSMITAIEGTMLEKSGTAKEMLAKVPGMTQRGDDLEVLGKGAPVFYINGRKVNDKDELKRLRSEEIKDVEVITNPGAQYDATVSAVVRIKTLRRQGSGFGFDLSMNDNSDLVYGYNDPSSTLNLRYRKGNVDVFGLINYWEWGGVQDSYPEQQLVQKVFEGDQKTSSTRINEQSTTLRTIEQIMHLRHEQKMKGINTNLGFNWQLADNHSIGLRIERHDLLKKDIPARIDTDLRQWHSNDKSNVYHEESHNIQHGTQKQPYNWEGNAYYNGRVGKLGIDLNLDFVTIKTIEDNDIVETINGVQSQMHSDAHNKSYMLADKLVLSYPLWHGQLQAGTEMSFVTRNAQYQIDHLSLPASHSEVKETNVATFVEYACMIPKVGNISAGVRYEHVGFDYTDLLNASKSMSRYSDDIFPSLSWANQWGSWQASLSYSFKTHRPDFQMLDESILYINSYSLQQGNSTLKNEKTQQLGLNLHWKFLNLYASYSRTDDGINNWSYIYNDLQDENSKPNNEGMILIKVINLPTPIHIASAYLSANPTFGCYSPNWTVGIQRYDVRNTLADPREETGKRDIHYHRPMFITDLNNTFRFRHSWQLEANLNSFTRGDFMNMRLMNDSWNLSFVIQKCWLKNDALCLRASLQDALQRTSQKVEMDCGYYLLHQHTINNRQRLDISLRYTFNAQQSKYKGTGAGKETAGRMN